MPLDNPPRLNETHVAALRDATILAADPLTIDLDGNPTAAVPAVTCLVAPEPGDRVLIASLGSGPVVLAILARTRPGPVTLQNAHGIALNAPALTLQATETLALRAPDATVEAENLTLQTGTTNLISRTATILADTLRTLAGRLDQVATSLTTHAETRTAVVTAIDTLEARAVHTEVETTLTIQASAAIVMGDGDIRMDATRIAFG